MTIQLEAIHGHAASILRDVPDVAVHDIYDPIGSKLYDAVAVQDAHELREMLAIARRTSGPILELACGAGRFTLPLLSLGRRVTAVDLSPSMLGILSDRLNARYTHLRDNLTLVESDICDFIPSYLFKTIIFGCVTVRHPGSAVVEAEPAGCDGVQDAWVWPSVICSPAGSLNARHNRTPSAAAARCLFMDSLFDPAAFP